MRKGIILLMVLLLSSVSLWGCGSSSVVATVNGKNITTQQLDAQVVPQEKNMAQQGYTFDGDQGKALDKLVRQSMLEQMINQELLKQDAEKQKLTPTDKEVTDQLANIKKQLGSDDAYKKYLDSVGQNEAGLKNMIKDQMALTKLQEKITANLASPTEKDVQAYYDAHKQQYNQPEQRQVSHILIGTGASSNGKNRSESDAKVLALQIVDKLKAGGNFAALAKQYSDDPGSKENGGQLPPFSQNGSMVKEFETAAFALQNKGALTVEPVRTQYGYHIIRLDAIIPASQKSFAEVKDSITSALKQQNVQAKMSAYVDELRNNAKIDNKLADKAANNAAGNNGNNNNSNSNKAGNGSNAGNTGNQSNKTAK
ncbi:MAG: peptidylprolyl isomerase [Firmicutes bacterium]|nr:peptidylprolyl isomerase [Bacillota bacterium]